MNRPALLRRLIDLDHQLANGGITLAEFAAEHHVTVAVVRSDLAALESSGQLIHRRRRPGKKAHRYFYLDAARRPFFCVTQPELRPPPVFHDVRPVW